MLRGVQDVATLERAPESMVLSGRSLMSARTGEKRLTLLMQQHFDFIWRSMRRLGLDVADADDATQEVFVLASRKLDVIALGSERPFLFGTALKIASTRRRTLRRRPEQTDVDVDEHDEQSAPGPERLTQLTQAREILQTLLAQMDLELRAPFVLFELEELTVSQIAELLSIPPGTVSSRLRAARAEFQAAVRRLQARDAFMGRTR
jgi:RNA polymerase sigma-70 factor, ECF subfamily